MGKRRAEDRNNLNQDLCDILYEFADYEKYKTRNVNKYVAYRQAARTLGSYPFKIRSGAEARRLHGIGPNIAEKIDKYLRAGKVPKLDTIRSEDKYKTVQQLVRVPGINPARASELFEEGVRTIEDLNQIKDRLNHHQIMGLKYFNDFQLKIPSNEITMIKKYIINEIAELDEKYIVKICGSYRRGKPLAGDIDCIITHTDYTSKDSDNKLKHEKLLRDVVVWLQRCKLIIDTLALGSTKFMGVCKLRNNKPARRLDIRLIPYDQYYCALLYFTGSEQFNKNIRAHALKKGFTLSEHSLRPIGITGALGEPVPITCEHEIFEYIDFPYRKPSERDN